MVHGPSPAPGTSDNGLWGVSCTAAGGAFCVAVGSYQDSLSATNHDLGSGIDHAFAEVERGGAWSLAQDVDKVAANSSRFYGVSCTSASQCDAVGVYRAGGTSYLLDDHWDGQNWAIVPTPATVANGTGVSCISATDCTEVGPTGRAFSWDGHSWSALTTPARPPGASEQTVDGISCAPGLCVAVGDYVEQGSELTFAEQGCASLGGTSDTSNAVPSLGMVVFPSVAAASYGRSAPAAVLRSAGSPPASGCPLDVTITASEHLPVRVGLAVHPQPYAPSQYPVDFVTGAAGAERCESGCVDLVVTVIDPRSHKAVKDAVVNASVSPIKVDLVTGDEALCVTNEDGTRDLACGPYLLGDRLDIRTDDDGHVYLRYWAPGLSNRRARCSGSPPA